MASGAGAAGRLAGSALVLVETGCWQADMTVAVAARRNRRRPETRRRGNLTDCILTSNLFVLRCYVFSFSFCNRGSIYRESGASSARGRTILQEPRPRVL